MGYNEQSFVQSNELFLGAETVIAGTVIGFDVNLGSLTGMYQQVQMSNNIGPIYRKYRFNLTITPTVALAQIQFALAIGETVGANNDITGIIICKDAVSVGTVVRSVPNGALFIINDPPAGAHDYCAFVDVKV